MYTEINTYCTQLIVRIEIHCYIVTMIEELVSFL